MPSPPTIPGPSPCPTREARFSPEQEAWELTRYADVAAALHNLHLAPAGPVQQENEASTDDVLRMQARAEVRQALAPIALRSWYAHMLEEATKLTAHFVIDQPVDLIADYAQPLCRQLATCVTGAPLEHANRLAQLAQTISAAAADPHDETLRIQADAAAQQMRPCFPAGPESLRDSGFVAISQTLVRLLANGWASLLLHPHQWALLHRQPDLTAKAVEEMLRHTALPRTLFRRATQNTQINAIRIAAGERVILRLDAANQDPARYAEPLTFDLARRDAGHFTLGAGTHSCVGAPLLRAAALAATLPLVQHFAMAELAEPVAWTGGSAFVSPISLRVRFS